MASVQSIALTVGPLGGQLHSLQTEVTVMKNADNEEDEFQERDGFSSEFGEREEVTAEALDEPKIQLFRTYAVLSGVEGGAVFKQDAFSLPSVVVLSFLAPRTHGGAVSQRNVVCFLSPAKVLVLFFTSKSLLAQYRPVRLHVSVFKEHGPFFFTSGSFGAVFVNLLFAQNRPGWMHLLATANYPRVMSLKNCLCLLLTGSFKAIQRNAGVFRCQRRVMVLLSPANHCCSLLSNVVARHRFQGAWPSLCCKRKSRCRFCQFVVRLFPSRLEALARNSQVSQSDVSHELFVFSSEWAI